MPPLPVLLVVKDQAANVALRSLFSPVAPVDVVHPPLMLGGRAYSSVVLCTSLDERETLWFNNEVLPRIVTEASA